MQQHVTFVYVFWFLAFPLLGLFFLLLLLWVRVVGMYAPLHSVDHGFIIVELYVTEVLTITKDKMKLV